MSPPPPATSPPSPPGSPSSDRGLVPGSPAEVKPKIEAKQEVSLEDVALSSPSRGGQRGDGPIPRSAQAPRARLYLDDDDDSELSDADDAPVGQPLPDLLAKNLNVVFCGIRGGTSAMKVGHHWGGEKSDHGYFYPLLRNVGFTDLLHHSLGDWTFPRRYSIGMTVLYTDAKGKVPKGNLTFSKPYIATLMSKITNFRPWVLCILGVEIAEIITLGLHQSTIEADPFYDLDKPTSPRQGWLPFKIEHQPEDGRPDATFLFVVRSPDRQASGSNAVRDAELAPLRTAIQHLRDGTFVEPADMRTASIGPLLEIAAAQARVKAEPQAPEPILPIAPGRRPRSSSADAASPPPAKRTRASAPSNSPANAEAGPSGYREESVDHSNNHEIEAVETKLEGGDIAFDSEADEDRSDLNVAPEDQKPVPAEIGLVAPSVKIEPKVENGMHKIKLEPKIEQV